MAMGLFDLSDSTTPLAIDASVTINLSACRVGGGILRAMGRPIIVSDVISEELLNDPPAGRDDAGQLRAWIEDGLIQEIPLAALDDAVFRSLVSGSASETLDDGEAATISLAIAHSAAAVLDERKAIRICGARYPAIHLASTTDLLLHPAVMAQFGESAISDALFDALTGARMRVLPHNLGRVLSLLGAARAELCPSLPRASRTWR
jgi:hypothetical protein